MNKRDPLIYMNGMTCLCCGHGFYDGYEQSRDAQKKGLTRPCNECGYQALASMNTSVFREIVRLRNYMRSNKVV